MGGKICGMPDAVTTLVWASSSREIYAGFSTGLLRVFDVDKGVADFVLPAHSGKITKMVWIDTVRRLFTASSDKTLKIWDFPHIKCFSIDESGFGTVPQIMEATDRACTPASGSTKDNFLEGDTLTTNLRAMKSMDPGPIGNPSSTVRDSFDDDLVGWDSSKDDPGPSTETQ